MQNEKFRTIEDNEFIHCGQRIGIRLVGAGIRHTIGTVVSVVDRMVEVKLDCLADVEEPFCKTRWHSIHEIGIVQA